MENNALTQSLRVSLDLGDIELSASELLELRAGSLIRLQRPLVLHGLLRVHCQSWARVKISILNDELQLCVTELTKLNNDSEGESSREIMLEDKQNILSGTKLLAPEFE